MRNRIIGKGNLHKSDYLRALITDTQPGDIPIIVSNDGFYRNMRNSNSDDANFDELIKAVLKPVGSYTIPYRYNIMRPGGLPRRLSLIHPSAQLAVAEFYKNNGELICYYCRKSEASLRAPEKIGSLYFVRGPISEKNALKGAGIDTVDIENAVANPASYFSYSGVDRAFRFFNSPDYIRLEKKYSVMYFSDVSKCFNSIYTHTLFWALADIKTAKDNTRAYTFSNTFDKIMQSMNFNETNGICVGAEVSRIFAELLLSEVDRRVIVALSKRNIKFGLNYEFRRYVDDFYIFSENQKTADSVIEVIQTQLSEFNLHLSESKTVKVPRPFITQKSRLINSANRSLESFFSKFIETSKGDDGSYTYPIKIYRPHFLLRFLLDEIKASCFDNKTGYESTSNYIIGAIASRIIVLITDFDQSGQDRLDRRDAYVDSIMLLLEALYFFYNVDPTVQSSLRVAQAAIFAFKFFERHIPDRSHFLSEQIVRWTVQFIRQATASLGGTLGICVPLEAINILVVLSEVGRNDVLAKKAILDFCIDVTEAGYFEIVAYLFCLKDDPEVSELRGRVFERACVLIRGKNRLRLDSESAHLAFDILSCPYITPAKRIVLLNDLRADLGISRLSLADAAITIETFVKAPWFVDWRETNLLSMIRKKELNPVY